MSLTEQFDQVTWPETYYIYVEKVGPFHETAPLAWVNLHQNISAIAEHNAVTGYLSLYKIGPLVYRAGVSVTSVPVNLPAGFDYVQFEGGKYARFLLTGPYQQLGEATSRAHDIIVASSFELADNYSIENYVNDPRVTPEEDLLTEILVPIS